MTQPINQNQSTNEFHISFTGHRPNNFPILKKPYEENQPFYRIMKQNIDSRLEQLIQNNPDKTIYGHTGLALGSDFIWTKSLIDMRQKYPDNVKIVADLAQREPNPKWHPDTKAEYRQLLKQADHVIDHSQLNASRNIYDQRDKEMIKIADAVIGVVDTTQKQSGTYKALNYAYQLGKPISWFTPQQIIQQMTDNQKQNTLNIETVYQKAAKKLVNHGPKIQDGYDLSLTGHRAYKAKRDENGKIMYDQYGQQIIETKLDTNIKTFSQANDLNRPYYQNLQKHLEDVIEANVQSKGLVNCHSGMALGADTVWAHAIVAMKEKYPNQVRFIADIPNTSQADPWKNPKLQQHWVDLLKQADKVNDWSYGDTYKNKQMQDHNKAMIDSCDTLIAIYDNSNESGSGTANAYNYAKEIGKDIYRADPRLFDNGVPEVPEQFKTNTQETQTQDMSESKESATYTIEESMEKLDQLIIDYHIRQEENNEMPIDEFRERLLQTVSENEREAFAKEIDEQENLVHFAVDRRIEYNEQQEDEKTNEITKTKVADSALEL